jgi:glutamate-1-semialdehyde 2,1-aminomutase
MEMRLMDSQAAGRVGSPVLLNLTLADAVDEAYEAFAVKRPRSRALHERAQGSMPGGNTRTALHFDPFPIYVERSRGAWLEDVDGFRYVDLLGEFSAGLYGHANTTLRAATLGAFDSGASNGAPAEAEVGFAELICNRFDGIEAVRFCNSGTEANLYALLLAMHTTGRKKLIAFHGAYHGGTFVFADPAGAMNAPFDWCFGTYNDTEATLRLMEELGEGLAAIIVEPMMSNGGSIPAEKGFLQAIRKKASELGAVLVFDEVVTSRMGPGGLQGMFDVLPDLTTLGKYLGAGFSFGAFGGRADLMSAMNPSLPGALPHAGTFNNNVFTMKAGYEGLSKLFTPQRAEQLYQDGEELRRRLNGIIAEFDVPAQFTGLGSVMSLHFMEGHISRPQDIDGAKAEFHKLFHMDMMSDGVYLARRGQFNLSLEIRAKERELIETATRSFFERRSNLLRTYVD